MLMNRRNSLLMIIDVQERLAPAMDDPRQVISNSARLVGAAKAMGVPFVITEQYPKGLGQTMIDVRQEAGDEAAFFSKLYFSCAREPEIMRAIQESGRRQIILAGAETHICLLQTAMDLKGQGYEVFVVSNASSSRDAVQNVMALQRMAHGGIDIVTSEMVIFEWLEKPEPMSSNKSSTNIFCKLNIKNRHAVIRCAGFIWQCVMNTCFCRKPGHN